MKNGNVEDFIDMLHYGEDVYLVYNNKRLFIDGWVDDGVFTLRMVDYDMINQESKYNFEISNKDKEIVINEFLSKKIWNDKTFYEEAKNIEWTEPF